MTPRTLNQPWAFKAWCKELPWDAGLRESGDTVKVDGRDVPIGDLANGLRDGRTAQSEWMMQNLRDTFDYRGVSLRDVSDRV